MADEAGVVTVDVWRVRARHIPAMLKSAATDRRRVRSFDGVLFAKLLGTSRGFSIRDADMTRWMLLTTWGSNDAALRFGESPMRQRWQRRAVESWHARLFPLASRGSWSRATPFAAKRPSQWDGPVAAITRARLSLRRAAGFWRAVPPVAADVGNRPGLRVAFGIGEAPLGVQGTFSVWRDTAALREFAYDGAVHRGAISATTARGWYAEHLFAHFGVLAAAGSLDGRNPLDGAVSDR
jgi:hypothetical protein